jgi:rare lipoprotein A
MDARHPTAQHFLGTALPPGLLWSGGASRRPATVLRGVCGTLLVVAAVFFALTWVGEEGARAVPFARARETLAEAAHVVQDLVPPPVLTPAPPEPFPYRVVEKLALGEASYYARAFEGRSTASGEPYHEEALTAAHPSLPFGSLLRVTNVRNGRSVVVRVNDRGPFAARRVVDLSRAAARELGMIQRGRARVQVELVKLLDGR